MRTNSNYGRKHREADKAAQAQRAIDYPSPPRKKLAKHSRPWWNNAQGKDWLAIGRRVRARGWCRSFTDFLLQVGIAKATSTKWACEHPEWKAICENFPVKAHTLDIQAISGGELYSASIWMRGARQSG